MKPNLATRIAQVIRTDFIESGVLTPGMPLPSIREMQQLYGTSVTTIAHALGQLEAQGVVEKQHGRGCFVKEAPEARRQREPLLGLIIQSPAERELMGRLYEGVARGARRHGAQVMIAAKEEGYEEEARLVAQMVDRGCDAIILNPVPRTFNQLGEDFLLDDALRTPVVLVDLGLSEHPWPKVNFDNRAAAYDMLRYLIAEGHERVAYTHFRGEHGEELAFRSLEERQKGYLMGLREAGRTPRPEDHWIVNFRPWWTDGFGNPIPEIFETLERWRAQDERATAVMTCTDPLAIAFIEAARRMAIRVPDELTVTGFDNLSIGRSIRPPFPTTHADFAMAGEKAVDLALGLLAGEVDRNTIYLLPVPVLPRRAGRDGAVAVSDDALTAVED